MVASWYFLLRSRTWCLQIEGAFVQGIGFFMLEEYTTNSDGLVDIEGTWTYKIPTIDTIPKQFNVELLSSGYNSKRVLSSKGRSLVYDNFSMHAQMEISPHYQVFSISFKPFGCTLSGKNVYLNS